MGKLNFYSDANFHQKVKIFSQEYLNCCNYLILRSSNKDINKMSFYSKLAATSRLLCDFIKLNQKYNSASWQLYFEACFVMNNFSTGAYWQKHITKFKLNYEMLQWDAFSGEADRAMMFFENTLVIIANKVIQEAKKLEIFTAFNSKKKLLDQDAFPSMNMGEDTGRKQVTLTEPRIAKTCNNNIIKLANNFLLLSSNFKKFNFFKLDDKSKIPSKEIDADTIRYFGMSINNLRMFFDRYFPCKNEPQLHSELERLRNYLDIMFYLLKYC